ncbi:MAG: hypothetical protein JRN06_05790 [Nitrososphaerota archaeon]|nr:hypothetical protein [Nitrososphaerota archaeon]MDG7024127.1 hypothetical protein [Nitrososphaerota archaeon]
MKVKIDFGRILPGLLLVALGLVLIAIFLIVAIVTFLFSFIPGLGGAAMAALELMLLPALLIAVGVVMVLTGISWWGKAGDSWFSGWAGRRAMKDRLRVSERTGELFGVVIAVIVFLFIYENQLRGAAFFAPSFGSLAQFFFYAPLFTGMILSFGRAVYGRRNAIRPFDSLNMLFLAVSAFWLLSVFPFDFSRFGEMFPSAIQFVFGWLNNAIGRVLFALAGVASLVNMVYTAVLYSAVRGQLRHLSA